MTMLQVSKMRNALLVLGLVALLPWPTMAATSYGPIARWCFHGNVQDAVGVYNGTPVGGVSFASGKAGQGCLLDGTSGYVDLPLALSDATDPTVNAVSVACWWKPNAVESEQFNECLIGGYWYHWFVSVPGNVPVACIYSSAQTLFTVSSNTVVPAGQWAHVAVVYDTDHSIRIYVDGVLRNSGTWQGTFTRAAASMAVGKRGSSYVGGTIDEMMVYNRALSGQEIKAIYEAQASNSQAPVFAETAPREGNEGERLQFTLPAADLTGAPLTYTTAELPPGAVFNAATREFSWLPSFTQAGICTVTFTVSNQTSSALQTVRVIVHNRPLGDVDDSGVVDILDLLYVRERLGRDPATHGDWLADVNEDGNINLLDLIAARSNFGARAEAIPPLPITDLETIYDAGQNTVVLRWTAPTAGSLSPPAVYEVRRAGSPIAADAAWNTATPVQGAPAPGSSGTPQSMAIDANTLPAGIVYFAMRSNDTEGNASDLSNSPFVQLPAAEGQWTVFQPSPDTRVIHVSSSSGNNAWDGLAPEWNGSSGPKATIAAGKALLRNGMPDWLLLKRGDTWYEALGWWGIDGRSATEPILISSYGSSTQRPLLKTGRESGFTSTAASKDVAFRNVAIIGIHFYAHTRDPRSADFAGPDGGQGVFIYHTGEHFLIEDCVFQFYMTGVVVQGDVSNGKTGMRDFKIRRSVIVDSYSTTSHSQGMFISDTDGALIEENVFDHNGWNTEVPGAQATMFNHNMYLYWCGAGVVMRGNISARASSHGATTRNSVIEDNLLIQNSVNLFAQDVARVADNVILEASLKGLSPDNRPRGWGIEGGTSAQSLFSGNIIANTPGGGNALQIGDAVQRSNNIIYNWGTVPTPDLYADPSRSVASYNKSIGGAESVDAFMADARKQSRFNWRQEYTAHAVNEYIRGGFANR